MIFSSIKSFLFGYYYQCVWDFFSTDNDIWNNFEQEAKWQFKADLLDEINILLFLNDKVEIYNIINSYAEDAGGLSFDNPEESLRFLSDLKLFLENSMNTNE